MPEKEVGAEKEVNFEQNIEKLEEIVKKLESGSISLDESLKLFETGVGIVSKCNKALDDAEQKVSVLLKKDTEMVQSDFEVQ